MPKEEQIIETNSPREDAVNYITNGRKNTLIVQNFLDAAPPSGQNPTPVHIAMVSTATFFSPSTINLFVYAPIK
jgi:hypothetical protein